MKKLYARISQDKWQHIEILADTPKELAEKCNTTPASILSAISHKHPTYERIIIDDDEEEEK